MRIPITIRIALLIIALAVPCYAIKLMMFSTVDLFIERATGIWVVEVLRKMQEPRGSLDGLGIVYEGQVQLSLKGEPKQGILSFHALSRDPMIGNRYLVMGFNRTAYGAWLDNGNVSPVEIPPSFSLNELEGKTLKEQILRILKARRDEIENFVKKLEKEKKTIDEGIESQKLLDSIKSSLNVEPTR